MTMKLPESIKAYFSADRAGGPDAVAAAFTAKAVIKDEGKTHVGHAAIREWKAESDQKYGATTVEPFLITVTNGKTQVTSHVAGNFPGSPVDLRYVFVLAGDKIAELEITV